MNDATTTIATLKECAQRFVQEREWGQFHNLKNLSMNLSIESAEVMEIFVWLDQQQSEAELQKRRTDIEDEIADVFLTIALFCTRANIDLSSALEKKLQKTATRYPIEQCKGKADKYTTYQTMKQDWGKGK